MLGLYAALAEEPVEDKAAVPEDPTLPARVRDAAERASGLGRARGGWISKLGR